LLFRLKLYSCGNVDATTVAQLMQGCPALDVEVNTVHETWMHWADDFFYCISVTHRKCPLFLVYRGFWSFCVEYWTYHLHFAPFLCAYVSMLHRPFFALSLKTPHFSFLPTFIPVTQRSALKQSHQKYLNVLKSSSPRMSVTITTAETEAVVQDAIVWANQHGLVSL
jgi:hypothetical protein